MTRRELAGLVAAAPAAARRLATPAHESPAPPAQSAAEDLRKNATAVRKLAVPAQTEPAFSFRAQ